MANLVLYMSMSLDGFITGPDDGPEHGLGVNGTRLHDWLTSGGIDPVSHRPSSGPSAQIFDEMMDTGSVIAGRRTFDIAQGWNGDHHNGVPVFVPTHTPPDGEPPGSVRFINDGIESCAEQAKAAAGDRNVMVHGANTAQELLRAGLLDEMEIHLVPVLLGEGRRLFESLGFEHIELLLTRALEAPGVVHLHYDVLYA